MNRILTFLFIFLPQVISFSVQTPQFFSYMDPVPGAKYVSKETGIIIKPSPSILRNTITEGRSIIVTGSVSGNHAVRYINPDDNSVIIFKPIMPFSPGETVTVKFGSSVKTTDGKSISPYSYSFYVRRKENVKGPVNLLGEINSAETERYSHSGNTRDGVNGFPVITVDYSSTPSDGYIFMSNIVFSPVIQNSPYLLILKNNGQPYYSKSMTTLCYDFKPQPNGNLTYYDGNNLKFYEMDTSYNTIDSFYCGNNYSTDVHELRVLPNGHAVLMCYDTETVDMAQIVNGGDSTARVVGLVLQEIDQNKNVVFQWRSWDHFQITDATHEVLTAAVIDYDHGNAIEIDNDGNWMLSSRHMDEITKINRSTGEIIWRLGGKNNQFTFINDPIGFSHQHALRRIANGNITMFDNGNFHTPSFSRAAEYTLDEVNKTATLVWQYRNTPDIYGQAMGYVERLDNGNTLIGWGAANPSVTEVKPDGTKVYELNLPVNVYSYRSFRYTWKEPSSQTVIPITHKLHQNFPNPFNPSTSIQFDIPTPATGAQNEQVTLIIYDALGREISQVINQSLKPGSYTVQWNAQGFASGIYFYRLKAGSYSATQKMMLVK